MATLDPSLPRAEPSRALPAPEPAAATMNKGQLIMSILQRCLVEAFLMGMFLMVLLISIAIAISEGA